MDAGPSYKYPALVAERALAETVLRAAQREGLLDPSRKVDNGHPVVIPVLWRADLPDLAQRLGARLVESPPLASREPRRTPYEEVVARLALPPELLALVPEKWERLGDVVVLKLPEALLPHARIVAAAFAEALGARCIVHDVSGVAGELREMQGEILYGDDPVGTIVENGIAYRLDTSRIMFSSGNVAERTRAATLDAAGETIVDMFAGIGYFTLPVALRTGAARVIAIEKNPASFAFLKENVRLNKVEHVVVPWLGDNRDFPEKGIADRVLMGYFPGCARFLPAALELLKPEGGRIHYHDTAHAASWKEEMTRTFLMAARACGRVVALEEAYVVKSYAPGVVHAVIVARIASRS